MDRQLHQASLTAASTSGTNAPAAGTSEAWTVAALAAVFPALSSGDTLSLVDATPGASTAQQNELIVVTASTGAGATAITVTRGADGTTPVAHSAGAVYNVIIAASALAYPTLPSYAPRGLRYAETWDARLSTYQFTSGTMHSMRASIKKVAAAVADMHAVALGDSTLSDYNGATYVAEYTIPRQMGKALARMIGDVSYADGYKRAMQAGAAAVGSDVTTTGACTTGIATSYALLTSTGAGTVTQVSRDPGTSVTILTSNLQTTGIAWKIDGVTQTPIVASGASTMRATTVTGLSNARHTVEIDPAAGQTMIYGGLWVSNPAVKQIYVHNLCLGGGRANSGTAGQNLNDVTSIGFGTIVQAEVTALGITPAYILLCAGNNDAFQSIAAATIMTGIHNVRGYWPAVPFVYMHPPMVPATPAANFDLMAGLFYSQAETDGAMLFDWDNYANRSASFIADGSAGADNTHPTDAERIGIGRHLAHAICDMTSPAERTYELQEAGGVYPPRPTQAADGMVNYTGADQPTDWRPGDTWDDLP